MEDRKKYDGLNTTLIQTLRKKIEELRESEEKFETIFESIPDGVLLADVSTMKFSFGNKAILCMLGYTADEIKKLSVNDIHPKKDLPYVRQVFEKQARKEMGIAPGLPVKRKDGSVFYADINSFPLVLNGKRYLAGVFRDMTEIKKAGEALKDAEEKWTSLTSNANDVIMIVDGKGIIYYINKTYPPYTPEETVGNSVYKYSLKEQHKIMKDSLKRVFKTGKPASYEISSDIPKIGIVAFSTKVVPIIINKKVVKAILLSTDITEQKKAEEALKRSEWGYKELAESISDVFFAVNKELRCTYWNKTSEKLTGISAKDALGKYIFDIVPAVAANRKAEVEEIFLKAMRTKQPQQVVNEAQLGGKDFFFEIKLYPSQDGASVFIKDITERKKAEEALKESNAFTESTLNSITDMFYAFDLKGKFLSWNKAFSRISGYSDQELSSKKPTDFFSGENIQRIAEAVKRIYTEGTSRIDANFVLKDGRQIPCEFTGSVLKDGKGHIIGFSGTGRDITERKKAEEALKESEEKFSSIVNSTQDGIMVTNLVNSRIRFANSAVAKMLGYKSSKAMIGKKAMKLYSNPEERKKIVDTLRKTGHVKVDLKLKKKSGGFVGILGSCTVQKDKKTGELQIQSIFKDVTEQEKVEDRLRTIEREFEKELHRLKKEARGKQ